MHGDELNSKSSAEKGRSQRGRESDPHQSESERYGSRGSEYASNPWESSRGFEEYGHGGMGQYSRVYEDQPWNTELGAGQYGTDRSGSDINVEMNRAPGSQMPPSGQSEAGMGSEQCYVDESGGIIDLDPACGLYGRHEYGAQMGYGHEVYQRGDYRVEGLSSMASRGAGPEAGPRFGQAPSRMQETGGQMRGDVVQPSFSQQQYQPSYGASEGAGQYAGTRPEQFGWRRPEEAQYQTTPSYGQMGSAGMQGELTDYGREIAIGGMPLYFTELRESEMRRMDQDEAMQRRRGMEQQYQPSFQQLQYQPSGPQSYSQQPGMQYAGTRPEQFRQRGTEEIWGFQESQRPSEQYQPQQYGMGGQEINAPEMRSKYEEQPTQQRQTSYSEQYAGAIPERYGQMGSRQMQGELTPVGWEIAMGGMPLYFQEMKESGWRQRALEDRQMGMGLQQYQPSYQGTQTWQTGPSYRMGQQVQGPYSQAVSQLPYSQPDMSSTGESFGPAAFGRGSYYGTMGLQQYGVPVQHERIPEPTSVWGGPAQGEAGMQGQRSMGGFEQGQYQPTYGQRGIESQYQQPQQYPPYQQYPQPQYESESSRGKAQYGMGRDQFAHWEGEPCMMGTETGQYSCSQFVTERYRGEVRSEQPGSGTEPLSKRASLEMTPYSQEPEDVTSPYGTMPRSVDVGREGQQMGQTACLMAYETGPYTGQSSYSSKQRGSLADFRKEQCGL